MDIINSRKRYPFGYQWEGTSNVLYELSFWYTGQTQPTQPQYVIERKKYSDSILPRFDLSKYANDFLVNIPWKLPFYGYAPDEGNAFVNCNVRTYRDGVFLEDKLFSIVYGYEDNAVGVTHKEMYPPNLPIRIVRNATVPVLLGAGTYSVEYFNAAGQLRARRTIVASTDGIYNATLETFSLQLAARVDIKVSGTTTVLYSYTIDNTSDCGYNARLTFRNSYGGISYFDVYGSIIKTVNTDRNKFEYYDSTKGRTSDNRENHHTWTINTGWIPEQYNVLIESIFISPILYLDEERLIVDGDSIQLQTRKRDGLINYTFQASSVLNFSDY